MAKQLTEIVRWLHNYQGVHLVLHAVFPSTVAIRMPSRAGKVSMMNGQWPSLLEAPALGSLVGHDRDWPDGSTSHDAARVHYGGCTRHTGSACSTRFKLAWTGHVDERHSRAIHGRCCSRLSSTQGVTEGVRAAHRAGHVQFCYYRGASVTESVA